MLDGDKKNIHGNYIKFYIVANKIYLYNYSEKTTV